MIDLPIVDHGVCGSLDLGLKVAKILRIETPFPKLKIIFEGHDEPVIVRVEKYLRADSTAKKMLCTELAEFNLIPKP